MGYVGIGINAGSLSGPLLGGVVFDKGGYYAVFGMCFVLLGVDFVLRLCLPDAAESSESREVADETSPLIEGRYTSDPGRPALLLLLQSRRLAVALFGSFVQSCLTSAFDSVISLFVQQRFNWDSTAAGLIFLPLALPSLLGPLIGSLTDRWGPRYFGTAGFLLASPCLVILRAIVNDSTESKVLLCALLFLIGISMQLVLSPLMAEISYAVESMESDSPGIFGSSSPYAQGFGLSSMAFAGGLVVGPIWAGLICDAAGWDAMVGSLGVVSGLTSIVMGGWLGV
ncbi:hypothetical protein AWENTII_006418 [Aspergillus wentii]